MALNFIVKFEESVIFVTGAFVALAMFTQVLLRYVFHAPLFGLEEIAVLVVSWFYFVGAAYSVHNESYIKADILPLVVKNPKIIRFLNILSLILTIVANLIYIKQKMRGSNNDEFNSSDSWFYSCNVYWGSCCFFLCSCRISSL